MPRSKVQRNEIKYKFSKHEIVWAKTAGYPWWPASITSIPSKNKYFYKVDFIGDRSQQLIYQKLSALLSEQKLARYLDFKDQFQSGKNTDKHFINAVTIAGKKYDQWVLKQVAIMKSKGSVECKTSQQKQQLNKQIQLPQIPQNIQQLSSINQQLYLCSPHLSPSIPHQLQAPLKPQQTLSFHPQPLIQQEAQLQIFQENQPQDISQPIDQQTRQKLIEQLLIKYKLNAIPDLREVRKAQQQRETNDRDKKKLHWKKKIITKRKDTQKASGEEDEFCEQDQMTRKIYRFLMCKLQSAENSRLISLSLREQIVRQKIQRVECLRKVMQWIEVTQAQNIVNYHGQWINFYKDTSERERQKHSSVTMEDQSEEISVK